VLDDDEAGVVVVGGNEEAEPWLTPLPTAIEWAEAWLGAPGDGMEDEGGTMPGIVGKLEGGREEAKEAEEEALVPADGTNGWREGLFGLFWGFLPGCPDDAVERS
jgi:hypothetical protein